MEQPINSRTRATIHAMIKVGVHQPRLAITELQTFVRLGDRGKLQKPELLTLETLINLS